MHALSVTVLLSRHFKLLLQAAQVTGDKKPGKKIFSGNEVSRFTISSGTRRRTRKVTSCVTVWTGEGTHTHTHTDTLQRARLGYQALISDVVERTRGWRRCLTPSTRSRPCLAPSSSLASDDRRLQAASSHSAIPSSCPNWRIKWSGNRNSVSWRSNVCITWNSHVRCRPGTWWPRKWWTIPVHLENIENLFHPRTINLMLWKNLYFTLSSSPF